MILPESLFRQISQMIPIPCVDLLIQDSQERILLVKRKNEPAAGFWWFPGGRVWFNELRIDAARRKTREETGLEAKKIIEIGTFDLIFSDVPTGIPSHGITTLFQVFVIETSPKLDDQSSAAEWHSREEWLRLDLHPFVRKMLNEGLIQSRE
jgi:ADP-ribose pyrophosphatase YjhB (NUDIX family)